MQLALIAEEFMNSVDAHYNEPYENELKELQILCMSVFNMLKIWNGILEEALDRIHKSNMSKLGWMVHLFVAVTVRSSRVLIINHLL